MSDIKMEKKIIYALAAVAVVLIIVLIAVSAQNHGLKDYIDEINTLLENTEAENLDLKELIEKQEKNSVSADKAAEEEIEKTKEELVKVKDELIKAKEDNSGLEAEVNRLNKEISILQTENKDLMLRADKSELQQELADVKSKLEETETDKKKLSDIYKKLTAFMKTDYSGTDVYYADKNIIFTDGEEKEITVTAKSARKYTTTVEGDNYGILTEWSSPFENYQAKLKIIPKNEGATKFHFTNSFNSDSFDVMVIYLK